MVGFAQVGTTGAAVGIDVRSSAINLSRKNYARMTNDTNLAWPSTPQGPANVIFERHNAFMPSLKHQVCPSLSIAHAGLTEGSRWKVASASARHSFMAFCAAVIGD